MAQARRENAVLVLGATGKTGRLLVEEVEQQSALHVWRYACFVWCSCMHMYCTFKVKV